MVAFYSSYMARVASIGKKPRGPLARKHQHLAGQRVLILPETMVGQVEKNVDTRHIEVVPLDSEILTSVRMHVRHLQPLTSAARQVIG